MASFFKFQLAAGFHQHPTSSTYYPDSENTITIPNAMDEAWTKRYLAGQVSNMIVLLRLKGPVRPKTPQQYNQDHRLNQTLRENAIGVRRDPYFDNLTLEGKNHEDFLGVWWLLESFLIQFSFPYDFKTDIEWGLEQEEIQEILDAFDKPIICI